ncbi:MAG: glycosyltransferase family 1 protein [Roseiarcus sp.]|jgi:glycosyltransferase involved in cell wall biosynthesis
MPGEPLTATIGRPLVYDLTYVVARLHAATPTGVERVDAAFARHFVGGPVSRIAAGVHYGLLRPHGFRPGTARRIVARIGKAWGEELAPADDPAYRAVTAWLQAEDGEARAAKDRAERAANPVPSGLDWLRREGEKLALRLRSDPGSGVPAEALYLNVAQYSFGQPAFFRWLDRRPDVRAVFFIHDLLPLDCPEFFYEGRAEMFARCVQTMTRYASAAIVSSKVVGERVEREMADRGRAGIPILVAPLPPPAHGASHIQDNGSAPPYYVVVGTIEARKNHLLLLNVWRSLARGPGPAPRLVVVGARGWDSEQALDLLERSRLLAPHVMEVSGLGTPGLQRLIGGARALLAPSFEEGYGLPIAEALAVGTPVVASDIPVFREISQGQALLLDPTDGPAWRAMIAEMTADKSPLREKWRAAAARYRAPDWGGYFAEVERFLAEL